MRRRSATARAYRRPHRRPCDDGPDGGAPARPVRRLLLPADVRRGRRADAAVLAAAARVRDRRRDAGSDRRQVAGRGPGQRRADPRRRDRAPRALSWAVAPAAARRADPRPADARATGPDAGPARAAADLPPRCERPVARERRARCAQAARHGSPGWSS